MRRRGPALGAAAVWLVVSAGGAARAQESITCPAGTERGAAQGAIGSEQWCERTSTNPRVRHGPFTSWHPDGTVQVRGEYRDGKASGAWKSWHPNGAQSGEITFVEGKPVGMLLGWYPNGQASFVGGFRDGTAIGTREIFDPQGRMRGSTDFGADGKERNRRAWNDASQAIDPASAEAHAFETRAVQSSLLIYMALMASRAE